MPSSALGTMLRIRRHASEMRKIILRADEGIGPYIGLVIGHANSNFCTKKRYRAGGAARSESKSE